MISAAYGDDAPIVALATPAFPSALAVLRISGRGCLAALEPLFSRSAALRSTQSGTAVHGWLLDDAGGPIDEAVVLVWRAPHGYTGEDAADIMIHGSPCAAARALSALRAAGFRDALPGEFSLRAFLAGKLDLTRAEAVAELVDSRTEAARADAVRRLHGALADLVARSRKTIEEALAVSYVQLDYAEDDGVPDMPLPLGPLNTVRDELKGLLAGWRSARLLAEGARLAIAGRTNAGKSSLFNLLLKEDRAIVSDVHGTTRDYLEAWIDLEGIPILLQDTAGIRESMDDLEARGIERARRLTHEADLVLWLVDSERGLGADDEAEIRALGNRCIPVWSRFDRATGPVPEGFLRLSCLSGEGFAALQAAVAGRLRGGLHREGGTELSIASVRQRDCIERACSALGTALEAHGSGEPLDAVAAELRIAMDALGELSGEVRDADILDAVFSRFCVGK